MSGGGSGTLSFAVWPSYIGLAAEGQEFLPVEQRSQIWWRAEETPDGPRTVGAAGGPNSGNSQGCWVPAGTYHKYMFYNSPNGASTAFMPMPHPHVQLVDGWVVVDPIVNSDPATLAVSGIAR